MSGRFLAAHPFFAVQNPFPAGIETGNAPLLGEGAGVGAGILHPLYLKKPISWIIELEGGCFKHFY